MDELYTCGTWTVIAGHEDEFIAAWQDMAQWTREHISGARWATLLQDSEQANRFLSFGPWESAEAIEAWRASEGFQVRVARLRPLLESFEPGTYRACAGV
jgi:heme-degrading monooxygenase HmoA